MTYSYSPTLDENGQVVKCLISVNQVYMLLDTGESNFFSTTHSKMISLIDADSGKRTRIVELLVSNPETAFLVFCSENEIEIPVVEEPVVEPSAEEESPLLNNN